VNLGIGAIYPKLHHGSTANVATMRGFESGWIDAWRSRGVAVIGWGWVEGDPETEAEIAVNICRAYDLDGYIANAEDPFENAGAWKSAPFVKRFRELAPHAPLGLSYIGDGYPYRNLDFAPWIAAGAALLPQCYWSTWATSIDPSMWAIDRLGAPHDIVFPTLGTSSFATPYPAEFYRSELDRYGRPYSVWLLESTTDDYLRALAP